MVPLLLSYLLPPPCIDCPAPFHQTFGKNPVDGWRIFSNSKKIAYFLHQKNPFHQRAIFILSPNISLIHSSSHWGCIILYHDFIYRYIRLILISPWLLNVIFSMIKALLNGQNLSKQNFQHFNAIWKTLLQLLFAFLFTPSLFLIPIILQLHSLQSNEN